MCCDQLGSDLATEVPAEVIQLIADSLSPSDLRTCCEVSKLWKEVFGDCVRQLTPSRLCNLAIPQRFPLLQRLDLSGLGDRPHTEEFQQIGQLQHLSWLSLQGCSSAEELTPLETITGNHLASLPVICPALVEPYWMVIRSHMSNSNAVTGCFEGAWPCLLCIPYLKAVSFHPDAAWRKCTPA